LDKPLTGKGAGNKAKKNSTSFKPGHWAKKNETSFKAGNSGSRKGRTYTRPLVANIKQEAVDMALETMWTKLREGNKEYTLFILDRVLPKCPPRMVELDIDAMVLEDFDSVKKAGEVIIDHLLKGKISIEDTLGLQKILENQHSFIFSDMVDFLMKTYKKNKLDTIVVGEGKTSMSEEEFNSFITTMQIESGKKDG